MTLEQFRATGRDCDDIGNAIKDECLVGFAGRLYLDTLYINRWDATAPTPPPNGPTWLLNIENMEWDGELAGLEERLYDWATSAGYFE